MESATGYHVRERGSPEGRAAFSKALEKLTTGMRPAKRRGIVAVFLSIYSTPFRDLLRKGGGVSGPDAIAAAEWAMRPLIGGLRKRPQKNLSRPKAYSTRALTCSLGPDTVSSRSETAGGRGKCILSQRP